MPDWAGTAVRLRGEHAGVLAAIEQQDAGLARRRIRNHIAGYYAQMTEEDA
jgi:DNA-binding GntR family transcriptional regulator